MVRGSVILGIGEDAILEVFEKLAAIKDIRMIKNRSTGDNKDFAFVEFYTPEETAHAFRIGNEPGFQIRGEHVDVLYSKNRRDERDTGTSNFNPHRISDYGSLGPHKRKREVRELTENYTQK